MFTYQTQITKNHLERIFVGIKVLELYHYPNKISTFLIDHLNKYYKLDINNGKVIIITDNSTKIIDSNYFRWKNSFTSPENEYIQNILKNEFQWKDYFDMDSMLCLKDNKLSTNNNAYYRINYCDLKLKYDYYIPALNIKNEICHILLNNGYKTEDLPCFNLSLSVYRINIYKE